MNLKEYLFYHDLTVKEFAKIADLHQCHLSSVMSGYKKATAKFLRVIERATNGKVKKEDVFAPTKMPEGWQEIK